MAKTPEEKMYKRLAEIEQLKAEIEERKTKLMKLMGFAEEKPKHDKTPDGFQLSDELLKILRQRNGEKMKTVQVVAEVKKQHNFMPDRKIVQSSLNYLVKKGEAKKVDRGVYRAVGSATASEVGLTAG